MITIEQVEKLRNYAKVSFQEAKEALEATNGDLLEAVIFLEQRGKIEPPEDQGTYQTEETTDHFHQEDQAHYESQYEKKSESQYTMRAQLKKLWNGFCVLVHKANTNYLLIRRRDGMATSIPVTLLILGLVFFFWIVGPLMVLGLFFGWSYQFAGPDLGKEAINKMMDSASRTAEDLKKTMKAEHQRHSGAAQSGKSDQDAYYHESRQTESYETAGQTESGNQAKTNAAANDEVEE